MGVRSAWRALWGLETKFSAAGPLFAMGSPGAAVWANRDYAGFAEEGYRKNVVAFQAINKVAGAVASVPWLLYAKSDLENEIEQHPLLDLLARPNPLMGQGEFLQNVVGYYLIAGNSYIEAAGPLRGTPNELWPLRPDKMKVIASDTGLPAGYKFTVGSQSRSWPADKVTGKSPILHLRTFNPLDNWYGMSPIEAAAFAIGIRNQSGQHNKALLQNDARPSGALVYSPKEGPATLSDEQYNKLKGALDKHAGSQNTGRPLLLEGGLVWHQMGMSPKDMDFLEANNASSRDISLAFGVPPQMLGIPGDSTFSNYQEARQAFWEETVIPLLHNLRDEFNNWLAPVFGDGLTLDHDLDEVPGLAAQREATWTRVAGSDFLTINEKRAAVGYEDIDGGDVLLVEASKLPLGEEMADPDMADAEAEANPPPGGTSADDAAKQARLAYGDTAKPKPNGAAAGAGCADAA